MKTPDLIEQEKVLKITYDDIITELGEDNKPTPKNVIEVYKKLISNISKYQFPTTSLNPSYFSTYDGPKMAYKCTACGALIMREYAKDYHYCPGCGLKLLLKINNTNTGGKE